MSVDAKQPGAAPDERDQLRSQIRELERQVARTQESEQFLQLITRALVSLDLLEPDSLCDTLTSLVMTFLEAQQGFSLLLRAGTDDLYVASHHGVPEPPALLAASALWRFILDGRVARAVSAGECQSRWPGVPAMLRDGFAAMAIHIRDRPVGLIVVANRYSGLPFTQRELDFLATVESVAVLALANAEAHVVQARLLRDMERRADEAAREAKEKAATLQELGEQLELIERQQLAIQQLSTPVLQIWDGVLALPIIGTVDSRRSAEIMDRLLAEVSIRRARFVILDLTGVEIVDTRTADHFIKMTQAIALLGSRCFLTGIRPAVAHTLVALGVDLSAVTTLQDLQAGLKECLRLMGRPRS